MSSLENNNISTRLNEEIENAIYALAGRIALHGFTSKDENNIPIAYDNIELTLSSDENNSDEFFELAMWVVELEFEKYIFMLVQLSENIEDEFSSYGEEGDIILIAYDKIEQQKQSAAHAELLKKLGVTK